MNRTRHPRWQPPDLFRSDPLFFLPWNFQPRTSAFFQSLANCLKFATHFSLLCFQSLPTIKFSNPLVLITIRNAGGWVVGALAEIFSKRTLTPLISDLSSSTSTLVPRIGRSPMWGFSSLLLHGSRITGHGSLHRNSFRCNTCEPLACVDSKRLTQTLSPLESALTSRSQLIENTPTLSPLDATLTRFRTVTPLEATLTKSGRGRGACSCVRQENSNSVRPPSSRLFSVPCALFRATNAAQLFCNQFLAHSFYRDGGVYPAPAAVAFSMGPPNNELVAQAGVAAGTVESPKLISAHLITDYYQRFRHA